MTDDRRKTDDQNRQGAPEHSDAELSQRLRGLGSALNKVQAERRAEERQAPPDRSSAASGMALAFRLGAEFVAGVLVGAGLGFGLDYVAGTSPWGMIIFLLLGFGAGVMNMMRAANEYGRKPPKGG